MCSSSHGIEQNGIMCLIAYAVKCMFMCLPRICTSAHVLVAYVSHGILYVSEPDALDDAHVLICMNSTR